MDRRAYMALGVLAVALAVVICLDAGSTVVRTVCAVPLALVLPGLMLTGAAFPARSLGVVQWVLFSLGLSVIVTVLAGFALNAMPWGLQQAPWAIALCAISVAGGLLAILRRPARVYALRSAAGFGMRPRAGSLALFGLAGLVVTAAFLVNALAAPSHASTFTQFWLTPAEPVAPRLIHLGIHSEEGASLHYRVVVMAGAHRVREWSDVPLASGGTWTADFSVPRSDGAVAVTALLYRLDRPSAVYRMVRLAASAL